jgi:hypothetical protein
MTSGTRSSRVRQGVKEKGRGICPNQCSTLPITNITNKKGKKVKSRPHGNLVVPARAWVLFKEFCVGAETNQPEFEI